MQPPGRSATSPRGYRIVCAARRCDIGSGMSRWIGCVVALLVSAWVHHAPPRAPDPPAAWAVAFERSIGALASAPVFTADGGVVSSGYRFDRAGRYVGPLAMEVEGGRVITRIRAVLRDGRAVVENHQEGLLFGTA